MAVHRYKVGESKKVSEVDTKKAVEKKTSSPKELKKPKKEKRVRLNEDGTPKRNIFKRFWDYVRGSWNELRQVRWPNRKQTWALTLAVIIFSLLVGGVIFGLDMLFTWLFKEVIL